MIIWHRPGDKLWSGRMLSLLTAALIWGTMGKWYREKMICVMKLSRNITNNAFMWSIFPAFRSCPVPMEIKNILQSEIRIIPFYPVHFIRGATGSCRRIDYLSHHIDINGQNDGCLGDKLPQSSDLWIFNIQFTRDVECWTHSQLTRDFGGRGGLGSPNVMNNAGHCCTLWIMKYYTGQ